MLAPSADTRAGAPGRLGADMDQFEKAPLDKAPFDKAPFEKALVAEGAKKAGLAWLTCSPGARPRAVWHLWVDAPDGGHLLFVCDGLEQPLPGLVDGSVVEVTLPSKDSRARLVTFFARAEVLLPTGASRADWLPAVAALHAQRLNP